jgi:hypothetical protein
MNEYDIRTSNLKHLDNLNKIAIILSSERHVQFVVRFVEKSCSLGKVDPISAYNFCSY